jgi:exonuclease SbcD
LAAAVRAKRYEEHAAFLDWLVARLDEHQVDVLLVAGDIFAPWRQPIMRRSCITVSSRAAATGCRHIVVTGGNHDSPSFLDAPKPLLAALQYPRDWEMTNPPEDEVLLLRDTRACRNWWSARCRFFGNGMCACRKKGKA